MMFQCLHVPTIHANMEEHVGRCQREGALLATVYLNGVDPHVASVSTLKSQQRMQLQR